MLEYIIHIDSQKYSFGLRARLRTYMYNSSRLTFGVLRPANFISDYIEIKQKVGGNVSLSMSEIPLFYCIKTPAMSYTDNWDLTSIKIKLENYVFVGSTYTYEMYVRSNIELKRQVNKKLILN